MLAPELMFHRRLARDYETLPARSEAMIHLAVTDLIARRLTGEATISWCDRTLKDQTPILDETSGENDLLCGRAAKAFDRHAQPRCRRAAVPRRRLRSGEHGRTAASHAIRSA